MILEVIFLILLANTFVYAYVLWRQRKVLKGPRPEVTKEMLSAKEYETAVAYSLAKCNYNIFLRFYEVAGSFVLLKILPCIYACRLKGLSGADLLTLCIYNLANSLINVPAEFYFDFIIERKYGFNNKSAYIFIKDFLLGTVLGVAFTAGIGYISLIFIGMSMSKAWIYWWASMSLCMVLISLLYPTWILPLYNKLSPLPAGSLEEKISQLAQRLSFTYSQILVIDGSKRSNHSNAFLCGFGKAKKIILYDTIIKQLTEEEILAVLAHELGHWYHSHILYLQGISISMLLATIYMFSRVMATSESLPGSLKIIYFLYLSSAVDLPLSILKNAIVRMLERQADRFSVKLGYGTDLRSGLIKIGKENMTTPVYDSLFSLINNSHPTLLERVTLIDNEIKKQQ